MRVVFIPKGGFNKSGAFIEVPDGAQPTGKEPQYQREAPLHVMLRCGAVRLVTTVSAREKPPTDEPTPAFIAPRRLETVGIIQKSRWGSHRFSILGHSREHERLNVTVHESEIERALFGGIKSIDDLDFQWDESFYLQVGLPSAKFEALLRDLAQPGAALMADVVVWKFPRLYAEWSPTASEGRVIKFLQDPRDVENLSDIPDEFYNQALHDELMLGTPEDPLVRLSVHRPIAGAEEVAEDPGYDDEPVPLAPAPPLPALGATPPAASLPPGFEKAARRVSWALYTVAVALLFVAFR